MSASEDCRPGARKAPDTPDALIAAIRQVAEQADGRAFTRDEFTRRTGITREHVQRHFPDGWRAAKEAAGLPGTVARSPRISDDAVLQEFHRVVQLVGGRAPTRAQFNSHSTYSHAVLNRFGGIRKAAERYRRWLAGRPDLAPAPGMPLGPPPPPLTTTAADQLRRLPERPNVPTLSPGIRPGPAAYLPVPAAPAAIPVLPPRVYGEPIPLRAMGYAPTNELGVVALFALLAEPLGFCIEAIHAGFPDCEAKRCIDRKRNRWRPVRIEFEFTSRAFLSHGHNTLACDLIICWNHNWPDCPLEVIELRQEVERLRKRFAPDSSD